VLWSPPSGDTPLTSNKYICIILKLFIFLVDCDTVSSEGTESGSENDEDNCCRQLSKRRRYSKNLPASECEQGAKKSEGEDIFLKLSQTTKF